MKRQIAKVINNGTYLIIHDDSDNYNPYRLYKVWHEAREGYRKTKRQKLIVKYADLRSCMVRLTNIISMDAYGFEVLKT